LTGLLIVGGSVTAFALLGNPFAAAKPELLPHVVTRGTLNLSVMQRGTLESAINRDIICRVKSGRNSATYIKSVIEDGAQVKAGQKLIELDASALEEDRRAQKILVDQAQASEVQAEEEYRIVVNQNLSDIETAKVNIILAALDLEKYTGLPRDSVEKMTVEELIRLDLHSRVPERGEYRQLLDEVNGRLKLAESDVEMWTERAAWSERMVKKGYITPTQSQSERSRLDSARETMKKTSMEAEVLQVFIKRRNETDLKSKLMEAKRALFSITAQARAKEVKAESDYNTKRSVHLQELAKLADVNTQINECTIYAPQAGMAVYYASDSFRFGGSQTMIAQGETVKEGQKLMRIPDLEHMLVNMRVHESAVRKILPDVWKPTGFSEALTHLQAAFLLTPHNSFALLSQTPLMATALEEYKDIYRDLDQIQLARGQKATIRIDAMPERVLNGHVKNVAAVATQDFMTPDVKMFQTLIAIDDSQPGLKPGMSAEVTIQIEDPITDALIIPVTAVVGGPELGRMRKCYVLVNNTPIERNIEIGQSNDTQVEVKSGLEEGEVVVLNPKEIVGDSMRTRQSGGASGKESKGGGGDATKKRGGPPSGSVPGGPSASTSRKQAAP